MQHDDAGRSRRQHECDRSNVNCFNSCEPHQEVGKGEALWLAENARRRPAELLHVDNRNMASGRRSTLSENSVIEKAVIPVAGLGTRMGPLSAVVPKAMLPLVDRAGRVRPVVHHICAEAASAGVDRAAVIVSPNQAEMIQSYLVAARAAGDANLPSEIEIIVQPSPQGFGHAVSLASDFIAGEAMLLMLGDHIYTPAADQPCAKQVVEAFARHCGAAMIGVQTVGPAELSRVGTARGEQVDGDVFRATDFIEKPGVEVARRRLVTPGLREDEFLGHCGLYCFSAEIFDCLDEAASAAKGELELAAAQSLLLRRHEQDYYLRRIRGQAYDAGNPAGYAAAFTAVSGLRG